MNYILLYYLIICFVSDSLQLGFYEFANKSISYCASRPSYEQCCATRDDNCVASIRVRSFESPDLFINHYCYCDYFCDREALGQGNDCCPDFKQVCEGKNLKFSSLQRDFSEDEFGSGEEEINEQINSEGKNLKKICNRYIRVGIIKSIY